MHRSHADAPAAPWRRMHLATSCPLTPSAPPAPPTGGMKAIEAAIERLSKTHMEHMSQYGTGNEERLTGKHETCDINTFKFGVADRGSSIRIPLPVQLKGYGYLEDRRPAANVDPYTVARLLIKTILK
jgi:glutamine synthetase